MQLTLVAPLLLVALVLGLAGWMVYAGEPVEMARCGLRSAAGVGSCALP